MKFLKIDPSGLLDLIDHTDGDPVLPALQGAVGGYVEALDLPMALVAWANEDGISLNMESNPVGTAVLRRFGWKGMGAWDGNVLGPIVFTGFHDETGNAVGLPSRAVADLVAVALSVGAMVPADLLED
jgi:hypothetical protein